MTSTKQKVDLGAELLASVREMKAGVRVSFHKANVSEIARARMVSGLSQFPLGISNVVCRKTEE